MSLEQQAAAYAAAATVSTPAQASAALSTPVHGPAPSEQPNTVIHRPMSIGPQGAAAGAGRNIVQMLEDVASPRGSAEERRVF